MRFLAIIFNIQRFSIEDGPGIRTTVFIKGCPLKCPWCSNPESQNPFSEVAHRDSACNKCGRCEVVCKAQSISLTDRGIKINRKTCTNCGKCVDVCITQALKLYGNEMSVDKVFQEVAKDKLFYKKSGGGVTASGGEPLSQPEFVASLFKQCQETGIHTCLDTCGYATASSWEKVLPYTSLVLFDLKIIEPSKHLAVTSKSNEKILQGLLLVINAEVPFIIRIPIIPSVNNSKENINGIARYLIGLNVRSEINLLPYHRFGQDKYAMLDREYRLNNITSPVVSHLEKLQNIFKSLNLNCKIVN